MNKGVWILCLCVWVAGCENGSNEPKVTGRWYAQSQVDLGRKVYAESLVSG